MANILDNTFLLKELKGRNEEVFQSLFNMYYPRLVGYAKKFVYDAEEARDLVQEVFVKFYEKRETLTDTSVRSLLFVMVRNSCLNYLKHLAIVEKYKEDYLNHFRGSEELYHRDFLGNTDQKLLYDELECEINHLLDNLSERSKEVFSMSRFEGLKNKEIAEKLGISTTAVEKHITKAIKHLKSHFFPINFS